jgi:hypothetical protein
MSTIFILAFFCAYSFKLTTQIGGERASASESVAFGWVNGLSPILCCSSDTYLYARFSDSLALAIFYSNHAFPTRLHNSRPIAFIKWLHSIAFSAISPLLVFYLRPASYARLADSRSVTTLKLIHYNSDSLSETCLLRSL